LLGRFTTEEEEVYYEEDANYEEVSSRS